MGSIRVSRASNKKHSGILSTPSDQGKAWLSITKKLWSCRQVDFTNDQSWKSPFRGHSIITPSLASDLLFFNVCMHSLTSCSLIKFLFWTIYLYLPYTPLSSTLVLLTVRVILCNFLLQNFLIAKLMKVLILMKLFYIGKFKLTL